MRRQGAAFFCAPDQCTSKKFDILPHVKTHSKWVSLPQLKTHSKCERKNGGSLRLVCGSVLESLAPARRIGQRWRATRAPSPVSIRMGRAKCSALFAAHPVLRKALNSSSYLSGCLVK